MDPENMTLPELGIPAAADTRLCVDWHQVAEGLAQTISDVVFKSWADGGASAVVSATKVFGSLKAEPTAGNRAFRLIALSFGWAIGQAINQYSVERSFISDAIKIALRQSKSQLESQPDIIGPFFLNNPLSSRFYSTLKKASLDHLMQYMTPLGFKRETIEAKIDISFIRALYEVWADSPSSYKELSSVLESPFTEISEAVLGWQNYRKTLISEFEVKPVFGQEVEGITLAQLYIPLRGFWPVKADDEAMVAYHHAGGKDTNVVMIDDELDDWLNRNDEHDWLKLIGGGPGSGKSTTLKRLASYYAKQDSWRPLFVPLQHIGIEGDLRQNTNAYFTERSGGSFKQPPLSRSSIENGPPLILIFDGLDELSAPNETASDVVQTFTGKLTSLYNSLVGDGRVKIKVVVSGRIPAFQAAKRFLPIVEGNAIEAVGYSPASKDTDDQSLWNLDQRPEWWRQYANAKGLDGQEVPEALSAQLLQGISHEPLLCYLLALSNYTGANWEEAANNTNLIYRALINSVYERGWGDGPQKRLGPGKSMTSAEFNKLMQTFGLAAWLGGDARIASETSFKSTLSVTRGESAWTAFEHDNGSDMNNLAMNFYLKSAEKTHRGFEFTHKSFGEYLAATALVEFASSLYDLVDRSLDAALQEWFKATKTGIFQYELLGFIKNEIRLMPVSSLTTLRAMKSSFEKLASALTADGFTAGGTSAFRAMEINHNYAEMGVWCILYGLITRINEIVEEREFVSVKWATPYDLGQIIHRRTTNDVFSMSPGDCMSYLDARGQNLVLVSCFGLNLYGANLTNVSFEHCGLIEADLRESLMFGTAFYGCHITQSNFDNAVVSKTNFNNCIFDDCTFEDVKIDTPRVDIDTLLKSDNLPGLDAGVLQVDYRKTSIDSELDWSDIRSRINLRIDKLEKLKTWRRDQQGER